MVLEELIDDPARSDGRIHRGDELVEVDGRSLMGLSYMEGVAMIRGSSKTATFRVRKRSGGAPSIPPREATPTTPPREATPSIPPREATPTTPLHEATPTKCNDGVPTTPSGSTDMVPKVPAAETGGIYVDEHGLVWERCVLCTIWNGVHK